MKSDIFTIIKKELFRFFGDKRMLTTAIMPGILIYVIYSFMGSGMSEVYTIEEDYAYDINVVHLPETLTFLEDTQGIRISKIKAEDMDMVKTAIEEEETDLLVVFPENFDAAVRNYEVSISTEDAPNIDMYYNSASVESSYAYDRMVEILNQIEESMANKFDICHRNDTYDLAKEEDISAMLVSMLMPMLILMMLFSGCLSSSAESIAGEKERGTIATLLVTPMKRSDLAIGKIISLSIIGLISGLSSFIGIMLSLPNLMSGSGLEEMKFGYQAGDYAVLLVIIISTTLLIVGVISIVSAFAKSVKEASSMCTPLMLAVTLIGVMNMMGNGMPQEWFWYLIPVYNTVQCMNGIFSMNYTIVPVVITIIANIIYAGIFAAVLTKMFHSERIMYN